MPSATTLAVTDGLSTIVASLVESFTAIGSSLSSMIGQVLPVALPIIGGVMVVTVGIKIFKKVTAKA